MVHVSASLILLIHSFISGGEWMMTARITRTILCNCLPQYISSQDVNRPALAILADSGVPPDQLTQHLGGWGGGGYSHPNPTHCSYTALNLIHIKGSG